MAPRGTINIVINNKQRDTGRFLFNSDKESKEEMRQKLLKKCEEFFEWYSTFQNQDPISRLNITSSDFKCSSGCKAMPNFSLSAIGILFPEKDVQKIFQKLADKYLLQIELQLD